MKSKFLLNRTKGIITLGLSAGLLIGHPAFASGISSPGSENPVKEDPAKKSLSKKTKDNKTVSSRNNDVIKIYPDIIRRSMHVVAKENDGQEISFFVFDLQGTLLQNFKLKEKQREQITGLAKGRYQYRVFSGDEETANGQFEIR
jgi:hypothetical protein